MRDDERKRLEKLIGETDLLTLADSMADYYNRLKERGVPLAKAWQLTAQLHDYVCGATFEQRTVWIESDYE